MLYQPDTKIDIPGFGMLVITDECTTGKCRDRHEVTITYFPCKDSQDCSGLVIRLDSSGRRVIQELNLQAEEDAFDGIGIA
jgi:hypothetical protein